MDNDHRGGTTCTRSSHRARFVNRPPNACVSAAAADDRTGCRRLQTLLARVLTALRRVQGNGHLKMFLGIFTWTP